MGPAPEDLLRSAFARTQQSSEPRASGDGYGSDYAMGADVGRMLRLAARTGRPVEVLDRIADVFATADLDGYAVIELWLAQVEALRAVHRPREALTSLRRASDLAAGEGHAESLVICRAAEAELLLELGNPVEAVEAAAAALADCEWEPSAVDVGSARGRRSTAVAVVVAMCRAIGLDDQGARADLTLIGHDAGLPWVSGLIWRIEGAVRTAVEALRPARHHPFHPDVERLRRARAIAHSALRMVEERARTASDGAVVAPPAEMAPNVEARLEAQELGTILTEAEQWCSEVVRVIEGLAFAIDGDPRHALRELHDCRGVAARGGDRLGLQALWGVARIRALIRLDRVGEAIGEGRDLLVRLDPGDAGETTLALAYEVLRAEDAAQAVTRSGAAAFVQSMDRRMRQQRTMMGRLFDARVDSLRADEHRRTWASTASLDSLTGIVNRRALSIALSAAAGRPDQTPIALLRIDVDRLGAVNETQGHLAGDVVLQRVAAVLHDLVHHHEVVGRWAADEFLVIAERPAAQALALAEAIRARVPGAAAPALGRVVTVSIGVSIRSEPIGVEEWLHQADLALYSARRGQGDRAVLR